MATTRVKAETPAKPKPDPKTPAAAAEPAAEAGAQDGAEAEAEEDETPSAEADTGADAEADDDAEEEAEDEEEGDDAENEPVEGRDPSIPAEVLKKAVVEKPEAKPVPKGMRALLDSPRPFGIHIDGKLHRFNKGKTPLTDEQHEACQLDGYVEDNGASIVYRPAHKPKAAPVKAKGR